MTNDRDLEFIDEVIAELEQLLAKLRARRDEREDRDAGR